MYRMENATIFQDDAKVLAKAEVIAYDNRANEQVNLTVYIELTEQEQEEKPIIERVLRGLGYTYHGITNVVTTSVPFNAEQMWRYGKQLEPTDE